MQGCYFFGQMHSHSWHTGHSSVSQLLNAMVNESIKTMINIHAFFMIGFLRVKQMLTLDKDVS